MRPLIGITCDTYVKGPHRYHSAGEKYCQAILDCTDGLPVLIPALNADHHDYLDRLDGLLLTGGYSNIQRHHYGLDAAPDGEIEDPQRDRQDLSLIPAALKRGMPLFGICRGHQALNVALGGTLHPRVHELEGKQDHRENPDDPLEVQYGPAHPVLVSKGSQLASITGTDSFMVNSVHGQAIDRLADGLTIEAVAEDDTIEAISVKDSPNFAMAFQWHPEYCAKDNEISVKLYEAFNQSVLKYMTQK